MIFSIRKFEKNPPFRRTSIECAVYCPILASPWPEEPVIRGFAIVTRRGRLHVHGGTREI